MSLLRRQFTVFLLLLFLRRPRRAAFLLVAGLLVAGLLIAIAALSWRFGRTLDETRGMITDLDEVAVHAPAPIVAD